MLRLDDPADLGVAAISIGKGQRVAALTVGSAEPTLEVDAPEVVGRRDRSKSRRRRAIALRSANGERLEFFEAPWSHLIPARPLYLKNMAMIAR